MAKHNKEPSDNESRAFDKRLLSYEQRADVAQGKAAQAFGRLLSLAETRDSGQVRCIAQFIAATYNRVAFKFDLLDLRILDVQISDDMLASMDALRWEKHCGPIICTSTMWMRWPWRFCPSPRKCDPPNLSSAVRAPTAQRP